MKRTHRNLSNVCIWLFIILSTLCVTLITLSVGCSLEKNKLRTAPVGQLSKNHYILEPLTHRLLVR